MGNPRVASGEEWLAARKDLLAREKEATRAKDAVDAARRGLPVTEVTKDYAVTGPGGQAGSDFNYDFHVSFDEGKAPLEYNYQDKATLEREAPYIRSGTDGPGVSVFLRDAHRVFHTYSAYQRGLDSLLGSYRWLELTPSGRQRHVTEFPHHDTYDQEP